MHIQTEQGRDRFAGKVVLVSGSASGIGRATSVLLIEQGAIVIAADIDDNPDAVPGAAAFIRHDVTDLSAWRTLSDRVAGEFGRIDCLVNCAGILGEGTLDTTTLDQWRRIMAVNVEGTFYGCQAVTPHMPVSGGAIVNIASVSAHRGDPDLLAYTTSKASVANFTREVALDCARRGLNIRCNSVSPGVVKTEMVQSFFAATPQATLGDWLSTQPISREIEPGEVAEMICFLLSSDASFITGADFAIDCGATA